MSEPAPSSPPPQRATASKRDNRNLRRATASKMRQSQPERPAVASSALARGGDLGDRMI